MGNTFCSPASNGYPETTTRPRRRLKENRQHCYLRGTSPAPSTVWSRPPQKMEKLLNAIATSPSSSCKRRHKCGSATSALKTRDMDRANESVKWLWAAVDSCGQAKNSHGHEVDMSRSGSSACFFGLSTSKASRSGRIKAIGISELEVLELN